MVEKRVYGFGEFRLDIGERTLENAGHPVAIAPKAFDVLVSLVENRGHIVEKQELMRQVWPDIFVEENNLAFNVSVLRKLLGESSASPRFIETIPKRGYRFIAEVIEIPGKGLQSTPAIDARSMPGRVGTFARLLRQPIVLVMGAVLAVASVTFLAARWQPAKKLTNKDTVVIADVANKTGDPVFDETLRQGLTIQLEQSPFISLISDARIRHTLQLMKRSDDDPLTPELALEVCERTASAAVLEGSIASLGSEYVLSFQAKNCANGEVLDNEQVQVKRKEDVLDALSRIARRFRSRMGESGPSLQKHDVPLMEVTTPSLEALKAYTASIKVGYARGCAASVPYGRLAVELDPQFAMAHSHLGRCYSNLGEYVLSRDSIQKAYELRNRTSDREKFYIAVNYQRQVLGNLQRSREVAELWAQAYPRDATAYGTLAGTIDQGSGKFDESIQEAHKAITLDPDMAPSYAALGFANLYLDRPAEAAKVLQRAFTRNLDTPDLLLLRYYTAFLCGDEEGMEQAAAHARGRPGAEDALSNSQALFLARSGQIQLARKMSRDAIDLAEHAGQRERAATYQTAGAVWEALFGNASAAKQKTLQALASSKGRDVEYGAALALAITGDRPRAQALASDLEKRFPEDTFVQFTYLPTVRGLIELNRREPSRAIEELQAAIPDELAEPGISLFAFFGSLYSAYARGDAYLALHQGTAAAAEFKKVVDHRGIVLADPVGAAARLQLARAFAMAGYKEKAKIAYEDFFGLWKNADPDIPMLKQAKAEYKNL